MTGWIKMGVSLRSHPKVVRLASALKADKNRVLGGLFSMWCVFDAHSENGELEGYTPDAMDAEIGWRGFSAALLSIGWLEADDVGLVAPRFEEHNGASAKRRALDASRKGKTRTGTGQVSASEADKVRNREEKKREEKKKDTGTVVPAALLAADDRKDAVFALGLPLLTTGGVEEKQARRFLGFLRKHNTDAEVIEALKRCAVERAVQPVAFLQACLKTTKKHDNKQEAIETSNAAIGDRWLAEMQAKERADAPH